MDIQRKVIMSWNYTVVIIRQAHLSAWRNDRI